MKNLNNLVIGRSVAVVVGVLLVGVGAYYLYSKPTSPQPEKTMAENTTTEAATTTTPTKLPVATPTKPLPTPTGTLAITNDSVLPNATSGEPYTVTIKATGGPGATYGYKWSVDGGAAAFPVAGLGLSSSFGNPISIAGTPGEVYFSGVKTTLPVTFTLALTVTSGSDTVTKQFKLKLYPAPSE